MAKSQLKKTLRLWHLIFFGVGTMLGAGIYVLVGKVAGVSGFLAPAAFLFSALLAGFTAFSFAELSARYPKSGGVVVYVQEAFHKRNLSIVIGYLILITGVVSTAAMMRGFVGYFNIFFSVPDWLVIFTTIVLLSAICIRGIAESITLVVVITLFEVGGLLLVIYLAGGNVTGTQEISNRLIPSLEWANVSPIVLGAFLAFYAYIGFEDFANIAEEVKNPQRNLPIAIIASLLITTVLYIVISIVAVLALPLEELAASDAPLADILVQYGAQYPLIISAISMISVLNGAIAQIIMGSRVLYGMSEEKLAPTYFYKLHPTYQTPVRTTVLTGGIIVLLALFFPIVPLAEATSFVIILIFLVVNLSLIFLKRQIPKPKGVRTIPVFIPVIGLLLCAWFLSFRIYTFFQ